MTMKPLKFHDTMVKNPSRIYLDTQLLLTLMLEDDRDALKKIRKRLI